MLDFIPFACHQRKMTDSYCLFLFRPPNPAKRIFSFCFSFHYALKRATSSPNSRTRDVVYDLIAFPAERMLEMNK
jgi:hypothetical protein